MSRIGKKFIEIPKGAEIKVTETDITVKGPRGTLTMKTARGIKIVIADNKVTVERASNSKDLRAMHGLYRAMINNMLIGVTKGFDVALELVGVGYKALKQGREIKLQIGYSHPINIIPPQGIEIEVEGQNKLKVVGADKELVGQIAANIRRIRPPEPYKGKGIKYALEVVRRKAGKTAKVAGAAK